MSGYGSSPISQEGALKTSDQDHHTEVIDLYLCQRLSFVTPLTNMPLDGITLSIETDGFVPDVAEDHWLCLKEGTAFLQVQILGVTPLGGDQYELTIDSPVDYAFTTNAHVTIINVNLAIDGSVTPVDFIMTPAFLDPDIEFDINRLIFTFLGVGYGSPDPDPDDGGFGASGPLTKGLVVRSENGIHKNTFNVKTNFDLRSRAYNVEYIPANKNGFYSVGARKTFNGKDKSGSTIRMKGAVLDVDADRLRAIVQDNLADHERILICAHGHVREV